jgi:hypothetical protein
MNFNPKIKHDHPKQMTTIPIQCIINATKEANREEIKITPDTGKANPVPASNCDVGAISESCATMFVTQNKPKNITTIKN